ncbi:MAG: type II secretion system GspH family protein [Bacilli bacterium]|nr:type II secretion system GspH family protein [Bacilli bacterium]
MKRGFAILETLIVITFLAVSLLMLYSTFTSMVNNSKRNLLYDNVSDIYKVDYLKEYLMLDKLATLVDESKIKMISCSDFSLASCNSLINEMKINKMYVVKYDLKNYEQDLYSSSFNNYLDTLSNKGDYKYRLVVEFAGEDNYQYASIGFNGETHE